MAIKRKAASGPTTVEPVAPAKPTKAEIMERVEECLAEQVRHIGRNLAEIARRKAGEFNEAEAQATSGTEYHAAVRTMTQTYWGLPEAFELAGKLDVYETVRSKFDQLKQDPGGPSPESVLDALVAFVRRIALDDTRRFESSSNGFSNLIAAHSGDGRGRAYQDLDGRLSVHRNRLDRAE